MDNRKDSYQSISEMSYHSQEVKKQNNISEKSKLIKIAVVVIAFLGSVFLIIGCIKGFSNNSGTSSISFNLIPTSPEKCAEEFVFNMFLGVEGAVKPKEMVKYFKEAYPECIWSYFPSEEELEELQTSFNQLDEDVKKLFKQIEIDIVSKVECEKADLKIFEKAVENEFGEKITFEKGWTLEADVSYPETEDMDAMVERMTLVVLECDGKRAVYGIDDEYIWDSL